MEKIKGITAFIFCFIAALSVGQSVAAEGPADASCLKCHKTDQGKIVHPVKGCITCHNITNDKEKHTMSLVMEQPDLCYTCHNKARFSKQSQHPPVTFGLCTACHNPHSGDDDNLLVNQIPDLCYVCHDKTAFSQKIIHGPVQGGKCPFCHSPHSSDSDDGYMLMVNLPNLCFQCHDQKLFGPKRTNHPPVQAGICTYCHSPHSSPNPFRMKQPINDICLSCHDREDIKSGAHVIKGVSGTGHPLKGKPDPRRKGRELACSSCHNPHGSQSVRMFRYPAETPFDMCPYCHQK